MDVHEHGRLTITLRFSQDNATEKIALKKSQRLQVAFKIAETFCKKVASMTHNNIPLSMFQFVHETGMKDGDEIVVTEAAYPDGVEPPQKKQKTSETTSVAVVANNNSSSSNTI
jgi:hypothetical protein